MRERTPGTRPAPSKVRGLGRPASVAALTPRFVLRFRPSAPLTDGLFESLAAENPELRLERTASRELEVMSPTGGESSHKNFDLTTQLGVWTRRQGRGLGRGFDSSGGFVLPNGAIRSPDASWLRKDRWDALSRDSRKKFLPLCPDFVVEPRSESDDLTRLREKMREYVAQGARLGWLIDPPSGRVEVYRPGRRVERLVRPERLSGEDVLPGFVLDLGPILEL